MYLNKAIIAGNLTREPELKHLPSGSSVANFSLATNRRFKDASGNWQDATDYHNIVVFGKTAENVSKYLTKGSQVLVEGRIQTRSWEKDGAKQYRTEIVADQVQFGSKPTNANGTEKPSGQPLPRAQAQDEDSRIEYPENDINTEIPF